MTVSRVSFRPLLQSLVQEAQDLKELTIILRCHLHSAQRSLENALNSESRVSKLVEALVTASSPPSDDRNLGGLARGIRNSSKLTKLLGQCLEGCNAADSALGSLHVAPQRFDSIMLVCVTLTENVVPVLRALHLFRVHSPKLRHWAEKMTRVFSADNMILLSLLAELSATCAKFHHRFDTNRHQLARSNFYFAQLKSHLKRLFSLEDGKEPLVLCHEYTAGYLQRLSASVNLLEPEALVYDQCLVYFRAGYGNETNFRAAVGKQLGVIHAVVAQYLQSLEVEHNSSVTRSLQCFDLDHWVTQNFSDEALPEMLADLAAACHVDDSCLHY